MYKLLIADDHELLRDGLEQKIKRVLSDVLVRSAASFGDVLNRLKTETYDLLITDLSMEYSSPLAGVSKIVERHPELKVLVLSMYPSEAFAVRLLKMGVKGYLNKETQADEIHRAITDILAGKRYAERKILEQLLDEVAGEYENKLDALTQREMEVFLLLIAGISAKEISEEIHIHTSTIGTYRQRIFQKLGVDNMVELTLFAVKNDLIQ